MEYGAKETRKRALLNRARTNLISRTARVYSRLGRSLFKDLNAAVQPWVSNVLNEAEADAASGALSSFPPIPESFESSVREAMVYALAQGYWLQYVYMLECRAATLGQKYRGRVTLADGDELDEDALRKILESLVQSASTGNKSEWFKVIPVDAVRWIEGYTPKLAGVLENDILEKVRRVVRDSMYQGTTLKQRMDALKEAEPKIRTMAKNRIEAIARTEVTRADSMGRLIDMKSNPDVLGVEFSAILDDRTTGACQARHGLVMKMDDPRLPFNTPPLHVNCRSILLPATVYEHPDGLLTSREFDEAEPGTQRPEDIEAVRAVLGGGDIAVTPKPEAEPPSPLLDVHPSPEFLAELRAHQAANCGAGGEPLTEAQLLELEDALKRLLSKDSVRVAHRTDIKSLEGILRDGHFKSQFETGTSGGLYDPLKRADAEKKLMNYPIDLPASKRPLYGYLVDAPDLDAFNPDGWRAEGYGKAAIILKNSVKPWTTFTAGDTLTTIFEREECFAPSPLLAPSRDSLLAQKWIPAWGRLKRGELSTVRDLVDLRLVDNYVEAQLHGKSVTIDQIELIIFDADFRLDELPVALLGRKGIPWRQ